MEGKVLKRGVHFAVNGVYHSFFFIVILFVLVVGIVLFSDQVLRLEKLRMYSLVQFVEDKILYVTPSKGITPIEGKLVWAPYKRMGYYEANIICTNSNKLALTEVMRKMKKGQVKRFLEEKESNAQMLKVSRSTRENHIQKYQINKDNCAEHSGGGNFQKAFVENVLSNDNIKTNSVSENVLNSNSEAISHVSRSARENHKNNCGKEFDNIQKYQINKDNCAEHSAGGNIQKTLVENTLSNGNTKTNSVSGNVSSSSSEVISHVKEPLEKNKSKEQLLKVIISTKENHKINCGKKFDNVLKYKSIKDNCAEHSGGGHFQKTFVENVLSNGNTKTNSVSGNVSSSSSEVISHVKEPLEKNKSKEQLLKVTISTKENHTINCGKKFDNVLKYKSIKDNCAEHSGGGHFQKTFVENALSNGNTKTNSVSGNVSSSSSEVISHVKKPLEKNKSNEQLLKVTISTRESHKINCGKKLDNVLKYKSIKDNCAEHSKGGNIQKTLVENTLSNGNTKTNSVSGNVSSSSSEVISHVDNSSHKSERKKSHKRHCCHFCKRIIFQIVRHWNSVHSQEDEVKVIMGLHVTNPLRRKKIDHLRRKGDFEFNKSNASNSNDYIVTRISNDQETMFVPCPSCLGYFSKNNLRHHKQRCSPNKGSRYLQGSSRKLTNHIHEKASDTLKNLITPDMFRDHVANQVFFDEILVTYGNYLCIKYTEHHLKNHIRAQLRLLGRFMIRVKAHDNNIKSCKELIHSRNIDTVRKAIDDVAEIDSSSNIYKHPTNARTLLTELKKIIQVVKSESDRTEDDILMKRTKGFSRRVKQELAPYINRVCKNSENKLRRSKQQKYNELPENEEIRKYLKVLSENIYFAQKKLERKFSHSVWAKLSQYLMVYLAVFNRKRPGETQRIEINDFYNRDCVSDKDLSYLEESDRIQADKYERVCFRGKLGNSTALLMDKVKIIPGVKLILKYRAAAGVHSLNRFLFAKPSEIEKNVTFDAYRCHKEFCKIMHINHENLTFTKLRKHFATEVAKKGTTQDEERRVSTYMSHDFNIHKKIYDQSAALMDITKVSKHLEGCMEKKHVEIEKKKVNLKFRNNFKKRSSQEDIAGECQKKILDKKETFIKNNRNTKKRRLLEQENSSDDSSIFDEPSLEEVEHCLGKYKRRRLWTSLEKQTTKDFFEEEICFNKIIENEKIRRFKELYKDVMIHRSVPMIKQWVEGEKLKTDERKQGFEGKRPRYSTPEKELLQSSMEYHSLEGSEPSLQELEELKSKHDIFQHRSAESLFKKYKEIRQKQSNSISNNTFD